MEKTKKRYRLLFVSHTAGMSGGERSMAEIVSVLAKREDVELGVVLPSKGKLETLLPQNVSLFYCETFWWIKNWYPSKYTVRDKFWIFRKNVKTARQIIKEYSPDIVITNTSVICGFAIAARIEGVRHCWYIRELVQKTLQSQFILGNWLTMKIISCLSDFIYVNSEYLKEECNRYFKNIFVVRQAIDCNNVQKKYALKEAINIAVIGHISSQKGQLEALNAYKILEDQGNNNTSLSFVGWGNENSEYYKNIKAQIGNRNIRFVQFVDNMETIYAETDIVLVCSLETFGRVSIEAMKHSIPIIAANVGASCYNIKNGYNGYLYEKNNPEDLANKIMLLQNPSIRREMGRNGYKFAMENYNDKNMVSDFLCPINSSLNIKIDICSN